MAKFNLTDKFVESPKRIPAAGRIDYHDALVPGLALRASSTGHRAFILLARYPTKPKNPTRRALGDYGELTLEQARAKAREWLAMLNRGVDPKIEAEKLRAAALRALHNNFGHVAEEFLRRYVKGEAYCELERIAAIYRETSPRLTPAKALAIAMSNHPKLVAISKKEGLVKKAYMDAIIRKEFIKRWANQPIGDITSKDCAEAIRVIVDRGTPGQARSAFEALRRVFSWAIGKHEFGIDTSPIATLRPTDLIGKKEIRNRILKDLELKAVWDGAAGGYKSPEKVGARLRALPEGDEMGYPYGPMIRFLILTGQREREVADASWSEFDFQKNIWTIPGDRMKGKHGTHIVPIAPDALALLKSLPRFTGGDFLFTTTNGKKSINGFSKAKIRIDKLSGVTEWTFHDLRRTMRTHLSALPVQDIVRELVIAHAQPGLHKVYDQYAYLDEKLECLTLWEQRLRRIITPQATAEVADFEEAKSARMQDHAPSTRIKTQAQAS